MTKNKLQKELIEDLVKDVDIERIVKVCVKEIIYEYFGGKPWLANSQIEYLAKDVLSDIFKSELDGVKLKFSVNANIDKPERRLCMKVKCKICKVPTSYEGTELCNRCWELLRCLDSLEKENKPAHDKLLKDRLKGE